MTYHSLTPLTKVERLADLFMSRATTLRSSAACTMHTARAIRSGSMYDESCSMRGMADRLEVAAMWLLR